MKADRFTYVAPPTVAKVTPTSGAGARVTVKGKNFSHVKAVLFGKTKGTKIHVVSTTTLLVTAPAHTPGTVDVHVTTAYGTSKTVKLGHFAYPATTPIPPTRTPPTPPTPPTISAITLPTRPKERPTPARRSPRPPGSTRTPGLLTGCPAG